MTSTSSPQLSAWVTIAGSKIDFEDCTAGCGIKPDKTWKARPSVAKTLGARHEWSVGFERQPYYGVDDAVAAVLDRVWPHKDKLLAYATKHGLSILTTCNATITKERPIYALSPKTIQRLADLGSEFALDIFDYSEGGESS